jgi:hypothetical protein
MGREQLVPRVPLHTNVTLYELEKNLKLNLKEN